MSALNVETINARTLESPDGGFPDNLVTALAFAWVNFTGSGTVAINDSHNVSSVSDNGTGQYRVNFENEASVTTYASIASAAYGDATTSTNSHLVTGFNIYHKKTLVAGYVDAAIVNAIAFGGA